MNNETIIRHWLESRPEAALRIACRAVTPLMLDGDGDWIGEADFPSGADYIEHVFDIIEATGLPRHIDNLQKNGKAN